MNIPVETKPAFWGVVGGAVALAIIGFSWGGWTTASSAASSARVQVDTAVVTALAPVCVDRFQRAGDAAVNLTALKQVAYGAQADFLVKGGWATVPGNNSPDRVSEVARACAALLLTSA